jgi:hypothetical protein
MQTVGEIAHRFDPRWERAALRAKGHSTRPPTQPRAKPAMLRLAAHPTRVLAWLIATTCVAHAGETAADASAAASDQSKLTAGAVLLTDYIYRGSSSHGR